MTAGCAQQERGGLVKNRWGGEPAENDEGKMRSQENWRKDSMLGIGVVAGDTLVTRLIVSEIVFYRSFGKTRNT